MADWIDVTRVLYDGMTGWPGDPPLRLRRVADAAVDFTSAEVPDRVLVTEISTSVHMGTHIDAPLHCSSTGADIASTSLDRLCGPAVVVAVSAAHDVGVDDVRSAPIRPGDRVLLRSVSALRSRQGAREAENGAEAVDGSSAAGGFRAITLEAAHWLVARGVVLVGTEAPSPDAAGAPDLPVHRFLLGAGIPIVENLDLVDAAPGRYEMVALPLRIAGCEASPARVILRAEQT